MFTGRASLAETACESRVRRPRTDAPAVSIGSVDGSSGTVVVEAIRPVHEPWSTDEWEAFAEAQQDLLADLDRDLRWADAARTVAVIDAYTASLRDLGNRFGPEYAHRGSLGAQTFFQSTGLRLGMSPLRVAHLVDTATTLRDALPLTWDAYLEGEATWIAVDRAVREAEGLDPAHLSAYDAEAAAAVVLTPAARLKATLHRIRERLQDDTADTRAKRTRDLRRVVVEQGHDGEAAITAIGPAVPIIGFDQALTKAAIAARLQEGETRSVGQLRFDVMMDLLVEGIKQSADPSWAGLTVPGRKGVIPAPVLMIPALSALGRSKEQARLIGYGPIAVETAKEIAGSATSFIRVLTDPITGVRLDMDRKQRIPPIDMRRWVTVRDELCRFPGCNRPAHLCDIDHIAEWQHVGVTATHNLVSLSRPHHRAKSAELWTEELLENGTVDWENPWGQTFTDPPPNPSDPAPPDLVERARRDVPDECPF